MAANAKFFAGANTAKGFYSCFDSIFSNRDIVFYIKGAPGTGKSVLMRKVSDALTREGEAVFEYYCSSDPDSLDGIACETKNVAMFDSTNPHSYEPSLPAARDIYLNLAEGVDVSALRAQRKRVEALSAGMSAIFERAYDYLAAADRVRGNEKPIESAEARAAILDALNNERASERPHGLVRRVFIRAHTCQGLIDFSDSLSPVSRVTVPARFGFGTTNLIESLCETVISGGHDAYVLLDPVTPARATGVYVPDARVCVEMSEYGSGSDVDLFAALTQKARASLLEAKLLHDEIEKCYTPHTDFSNMLQIEAQVMRAFEMAN